MHKILWNDKNFLQWMWLGKQTLIQALPRYYTVVHKNVAFYFCSYLRQLLTQFLKFFDWHTLQTICNNASIMYPTTTELC